MFPYYLLPNDDTKEADEDQQPSSYDPLSSIRPPQPVKKPPRSNKPKYTLAEQIRRRNQERARQDAAAQKRPPSIPTVIYTAFDRHRADEHRKRVQETRDRDKPKNGKKSQERGASEPSLSGFPQDIEWQPDISQANVFDLCDHLCEQNPQDMTAMMNFIEGSDPDDDEQTIRHRVNNHLRIMGLNDVFDRGDWYTTRPGPAAPLASPSFQNDTVDMAFADGNIGILQPDKPGVEAEAESQRINLVSLDHLRKHVNGWDVTWTTETDLSRFIINKLADAYEVEVPDDFANAPVEDQVMMLLQFVYYYREAYYSKTWQYESPYPWSILERDYDDLLPLLELLDPRPLADPAALLDVFSFQSEADAVDYLRPQVELVYAKLGHELPANWAEVDDAVLMANILHTGIEDMFIRHAADGMFLSDYDSSVFEFRREYSRRGYSTLNEDFQRLSGTYQSPDYSLFAFVLSIAFEPVDWVLTGAEVVDAASRGDWGAALIDFLLAAAPFVSGRMDNTIRHLREGGDNLLTVHLDLNQSAIEAMAAGRIVKPGSHTDLHQQLDAIDSRPIDRRYNVDWRDLKDKYNTFSGVAENEIGIRFWERGFNVVIKPTRDQLKAVGYTRSTKPDYIIEGQVFDAMTALTHKPRNIADRLKESKLETSQVDRVILDVTRSNVTLQNLSDQFTQWGDGMLYNLETGMDLKEMWIRDNDQLFPFLIVENSQIRMLWP